MYRNRTRSWGQIVVFTSIILRPILAPWLLGQFLVGFEIDIFESQMIHKECAGQAKIDAIV